MKTRVLRRTVANGDVRYEVQRLDEMDKVQPWLTCSVYSNADQAIGHAFRLSTPEHVVVEFGK